MNIVFKYAALASFSTLVFVHGVSAQQANDVEALQRRMNSLESKVDAIIDLMQKQQAGQNNNAPAEGLDKPTQQSTGSNIPDGFVSGMFLDVYSSSLQLLNSREDAQIEVPEAFPNASAKIAPQSTLPYGQFLKLKETQSLAGVSDSLVGVAYSSYLKIEKNGAHVFQVRTQGGKWKRCVTKLLVADKELISKDNHESGVSTEQKIVQLTPGLYKAKVFLACGRNYNHQYLSAFDEHDFDGVGVDFLMAEPGDHAPHPIPADRLLIKQ